MKKKIFYLIFTLFLFNLINYEIYAEGICKGKTKTANGYCSMDNSLYFDKNGTDLNFRGNKPHPADENRTNWYLIDTFTASTSTTNWKKDYQAICIDPSLAAPKYYDINNNPIYIAYNESREILSDTSGLIVKIYDTGVYSAYQKLVKALQSTSNEEEIKMNKIYYQFALRAWTYKNDFHVSEDGSVYKDYEWPNALKCAKLIDSSIDDVSGNRTTEYCFGNTTNENSVKEYYDAANKYYTKINSENNDTSDEDEAKEKLKQAQIWENPIKITKNFTSPTNTNDKYTFTFTFKGIKKFFENGTKVESLFLSAANISAEVYINDKSCSISGNCPTVINKVNLSNYNYDELKFEIVMTEAEYSKYFSSGNGKVVVKYSYNHPMLKENLFISHEKDISNYQRMLVMHNFVVNDEISIMIGKQTTDKFCSHTSEYGLLDEIGKSSIIENFIKKCGCDKVKKYLLDNNQKKYYIEKCGTTIKEEFYGSINNCTIDDYESYNLTYIKEEEPNQYCTKKCTENIKINNMSGTFETMVGRTFDFNKYPSLITSKSCDVAFDQISWLNDYKIRLELVVNAYNEYQKLLNTNTTSNTELNIYNYKYSYTKLNIGANGVTLFTTTDNGTLSSTESEIMYIDIKTKRLTLLNQIAYMNELLSKATDCSNSLGTAIEKFYDFKQELYFYYEQENKNGTIYNNANKNDFGGVNDSVYEVSTTINLPTTTTNSNVVEFSSIKYSDTNKKASISNENLVYNILNRKVENVYNYTPKEKFINVYTGKTIFNKKVSDKNYVSLGKVYDTDITSKAKINNIFYYEFRQLGENNKILNYFKNNGNYIKRECTYETKKSPNILYKIVDPNNVDPNGRLGTGKGFGNWTEEDVTKIETEDTYNPNNIQYSFDLDIKDLKEIREYNKGKKYYDFTLKCDANGNRCESKFIENYATNLSGREIWD